MKNRKFMPTTYLLISIIAIIGFHLITTGTRVDFYVLKLLGTIPLLFGVTINLIADNSFKKHNTTVKPYKESNALITTGIFSLTRNPMYLGFIMILLGIAILLGSITSYLIVILFAVHMRLQFVRTEETALEKRFGSKWYKYRDRVRRWV